jgi:hypothetical protein
MQQTSRNWLIDAVELIWQLLAVNSHWQELINSTDSFVSAEEKEVLSSIVSINNAMRRHLMQQIFDTFSWDHKYWCLLKHAIFSYELSCELLYSDSENKMFIALQQECSDNMYKILSKFIGTDVVMCWRCLNEIIEK